MRTDGYKGGIATGSTAYDSSSRRLNASLTRIKKELAKELSPMGYTMRTSLGATDCEFLLRRLSPDGGIWFDSGGRAIAAFEAKKQDHKGNAHERWFKNHAFLNRIHPNIRYVTFLSGSGCRTERTSEDNGDNAMGRDFMTFQRMHGRDFGTIYPYGVSFLASMDGFTDFEIAEAMRRAILQ